MRWVSSILLIVGMASPALAADYDIPILRGSQPPAPVVTVLPATFTRWSGFYVGGDFSFNNSSAEFSSATQPLFADSFRDLTLEEQAHPSQIQVLGKGTSNAFGGGGFVGYNTQWQDLILGVEANYTRTNLNSTAGSPPPSPASLGGVSSVGRIFPSLNNQVLLNANGNLDLTDYATLRFRAGYVVGNLLPYAFMGVAVGRASYGVSTAADVTQSSSKTSTPDYSCAGTGGATPTCQDFFFFNNAGQSNALLYGFSVGAGLDWALTQNIFLRSEFEFIQFAPISNISMYIMNARVGAGFKF